MMADLRGLLSEPAIAWAPRLTALSLLASRPWHQHEPPGTLPQFLGNVYLLLLVAALLSQEIAASPAFWFFLTGIHFLWILASYSFSDNHRYLEGYWCLAIAVSLWTGGAESSRYLALDAQYLIGLCFLFSIFWKAISPSFRNGSFFVERLLFDQRFLSIAVWAGGLSPKTHLKHWEARRRMRSGRSDWLQVRVPTRLIKTGVVLAWWTLSIEGINAILFLLPFPNLELGRVLALGIFAGSTYFLIPIHTFGQLLLLMLSVATRDVQLRMVVLGLAALLILFSGTPHLLERVAKRRMKIRLQAFLKGGYPSMPR
jgi:hypothetical protein